jgi:hypothetical protein
LAQQEILAVSHSARSGVFVPQVRRNPNAVDGKRNTRHVRDHPRTKEAEGHGRTCLLFVVGSSTAMQGLLLLDRRQSEKAFVLRRRRQYHRTAQMVNTDHGVVTSVPNHALTRADSDPVLPSLPKYRTHMGV